MQLTRAMMLAATVAAAQAALDRRRGDSVTLGSTGVGADLTTATHLHNDVPAFKDLGASAYKHVPPHLAGKFVTTPDSQVDAGFVARWACPGGRSEPCDAYLFLYECPPCVSKKGGLPALLNSDGWERSRCAPQFTTGTGSGQTHKMTAYKKQVAPGTEETVTMPGDVEYVSFALSFDSVDCSSLATQGACEDSSLQGQCQWNLGASKCQLAKCVGYGPNNNGCLSQCIADDLAPAAPMMR